MTGRENIVLKKWFSKKEDLPTETKIVFRNMVDRLRTDISITFNKDDAFLVVAAIDMLVKELPDDHLKAALNEAFHDFVMQQNDTAKSYTIKLKGAGWLVIQQVLERIEQQAYADKKGEVRTVIAYIADKIGKAAG
jgi:hypothetical protein